MNEENYFCALCLSKLAILHIIASNEDIAYEIANYFYEAEHFVLSISGKYSYTVPLNVKELFTKASIRQGYVIGKANPISFLSKRDILNDMLLFLEDSTL